MTKAERIGESLSLGLAFYRDRIAEQAAREPD